ncbi:hypothetical protein [uncultured Roseobacter sp.]|uniref:hypothetical protein n=1 Tax=uncultured Roseobacter sp. TaxID=114847 RepID=UPI00261CE151|nr:hypothetical protein [uncultured Roseobacter sp.]
MAKKPHKFHSLLSADILMIDQLLKLGMIDRRKNPEDREAISSLLPIRAPRF